MRTYKDIDVKYYDTEGNVHVRCNVPITEDALVHFELMQSHYCKLSFKQAKAVYFKRGDFIVTDYGRFELTDNVKPKDDGTLGYSYEMQFDAYYRKWKNKRLKYMPNSGSPEGTFSLTSNILTHANVIKDNLDFLAKVSKSYLYDPNYTGSGTDYTFAVDASVDKTKSKVIAYSNSSILDAIANIAQTFDCEWWVEGNIVHFGTCENTNEVVDFKDGENIVSMSSSQSQSSYANRVYAFGAARNLPSGYKQNSSADVTKNGVVEKRLMLPTLEECSDENKKLMAENGFELKDGCLQVKGLTEDEYVEGVTTNDDIYPRNLIKTSNVTYYEKEVEDESTPEEGDYIKRTYYKVNGLTIVDKDGNKTGDMAFRSSYILSGKTLHIIFQSGSLSGMDFECQFNPDGESEILRDANGSPILKDGKEQVNPAAQVFEVVANEDYGRFLPDTVLHPKDGDTFVLYNWDSTKLGDTLVNSSANELLTDTIRNLKKSMIDPTTYTCTADSGYSYNNGEGTFHFEGDRVNLYNKGYDEAFRASRIIGYELHLDIPFDSVKYTVGEKPAYSRLNAMSSQIEELIFNGQSYLNQGGNGGNSIYIIKSYDTTVQPTDFNVFSAKRVEKSYLHKDKEDAASYLIKFLQGLQLGTFSNMSGGDWSMDEEGRSHLITDYLEVRMKAFFEELVIKKTSTIGGKELISPAGSNVISDVEEVTVTYDNVEQTAYRCYFLAEQDGEEVDNDWAVGDQARSESFNVKAGTYHKVGNHFFWRLVIGCNDTDKPVEREGKKYHYIDISSLDYATASDVPMKGDVVNQCGNRTDITRQNCLVLSAVDTYSPSITLYHGINSYSFSNKEYVEYGVVKSTGKAFFNVYGDAYIGDRPTSANNYEGDSYIKYDSDKKKVVIKAELSIGSTVGDKPLDKYIEGKTMSEEQVNNLINNSTIINDLQNQIDGAIETWFYDGVPTLSNAPASDWKTDAVKNIHLGDLYYDNKTGKAYRFALDGSAYTWTVITDTDITKALSDAAKAQETADGKMTVFSSQPTPPYQTGDIWVNATYGTTYKNDVLRCKTAKGEGKSFDIADWMLASKYTDDTVAKEAKAAAELAQKNIKTTQESLKTLGGTVTENKNAFDKFTEDGYLDSSEIAAMAQDSKRLEDAFTAAEKTYNEVKDSKSLLDESGNDTKYKTDLINAYNDLVEKKKSLLAYLSDIVTRYNDADSDGKAAINAAVANEYSNFQTSYTTFYNALGVANNYIISNLYDGLNTNITNIAGLDYIKAALVDGQPTDIKKGLILSTLIALRNADGEVTSGINGADTKDDGIALWLGGKMIDRLSSTTTESEKASAAKSLLRFDGTGYFANGNLWWDKDGKLHSDPSSFIINESNLGVYLSLFEPTWKPGLSADDYNIVKNIASLTPCAPFNGLSVAGNVDVEDGYVKIGGAYLVYKDGSLMMSADKDGEKALNVFATGGISAYGSSSGSGSGGGLNGNIISYATAINMTTSDESTEVASAWSIKKLSDRIKEVSSAIPSISVDVPTSGNAITGASYDEATGKLSFTKGTFLTSHQSLSAYLKSEDAAKVYAPVSHTHTKANITDMPTDLGDFTNTAGFTKNKGTVTSVKLTAPTGFTVTNGTVTTSGTIALGFATGYSLPSDATQEKWTSAYDWYKLMTTDEEEADGVINKWNEVVNFLANISQTDTLSGIVDGINTSITDEVTRAKKAEKANADNITANANSIKTLKGYFDANGNAKKALQLTNARKLWGNSFNGTSDINGNITMQSTDGTYIQIGGVRIVYDEKNTALKVVKSDGTTAANLYATGGVSAYGSSSISGAGGGLNGNVLSYESAKALTSNTDETTQIASAWSIKKLSDQINELDLSGSAKASISATTSGAGNAITSASYDSETGKFTFTKGSTFSLSSHTHNYLSKLTVGTKEYTVTSNGITIPAYPTTLPASDVSAWAKAATKPSYTASEVGAAASSHTHTVKINGSTKTIAATGGTSVDLGTYLTAHQTLYGLTIQRNGTSLGTYTPNSAAKTINVSVPTKISQLTDDSYGYIMREYTIDASSLDENTYYPVVFSLGAKEDVQIQCTVPLNSGTKPSWSTHSTGGFGVCVIWKTSGFGWGVGRIHRRILVSDYWYASSNPLVGIGQLDRSSTEFVYVRGGGKYFFRTSHNIVPELKTESYMPGGSGYAQTVAPTTTRPAEITRTIAYISDNVASATKLATARTINGTSFNGTADITTTKWGTARNVGIVNSDGTGTAVTVSVDGSAAVNLKLPSTIKASLTGNADTATKLKTARTLWGQSFDGSANVSGDMTGIGSTGNARFNIKGVAPAGYADYIHLYVDGGGNNSRYLVLQNGYGNVGIGTIPTEKLHVAGKINLNGIVLEYDSTNKALKVNGNLYATGGITAYGEGSASGSGGLNGSVYEYSKAILETSDSTTKIASAYSIAKLKSLIDSIDGSALTEVDWSIIKNKPSSFTPASHTHTFASLTSKPTSLSGFGITDGVNSVSVSGSGNAVTSASISNHTLTLTKGSTFLTSHQSLAGYATQSWVNTRLFQRTASTDANSIVSEGLKVYEIENGSNMPTSNNWHQVMGWGTADENYVFQMANTYSSFGSLYIRQKVVGTWGSWKRLALAEEIPSLSNYVTLNGSQTISALKTFSLGSFGAISIKRTDDTNGAAIQFRGSNNIYGYIGFNGATKDKQLQRWSVDTNSQYDILDSSTTSLSGNTVKINGTSKTFLSSHQSIYSLTIQKNGSNLGTYIPSSASKTINIGVPTNVSELTNDRGYLTQHQKFSDLIGTLSAGVSDFTDGTEIVTSFASDNGFSDSNSINIPYKRKASSMWSYIKGKSDGRYLQLSGGTMSNGARISHGGSLYLGRGDNSGWVYTQNITSQNGSDKWSIRVAGAAHFGDIYIASNSDNTLNSNVISAYNAKLFLQYGTSNDLMLCSGGGGVVIGSTNKYTGAKLTVNDEDICLYNINHGETPHIHFCRSEDGGKISDYSSWIMYGGIGHFYIDVRDNNNRAHILDLLRSQVVINTNLFATGGITAYLSSDLRLKSNLHKADSLQLIKSLGTVYEFDYTKTHEHSYGLIAQNVQKSRLSDLVGKDEDGYLKLNYWSPKLISLALGGIVQVDDKVTKLKRKVKALEKEVKSLRDELNNKKEDKDNININA